MQSSVEHSHALSQEGLRASTQKKGRVRIDRESSKGENQGPDLFVRAFILHPFHPSKPTPPCDVLDQVLTYTTYLCTWLPAPHLSPQRKEEIKGKRSLTPDLQLSGLSVCDYIFRHSLVASLIFLHNSVIGV